MGSFWKSKVVPKFKKLFEKSRAKKQGAEICKAFHKSKDSLDKEIEEKNADLSPKVVEIYRSSSSYISKKLLKEPDEAAVKKNPEEVQSVLQELVNGGFPGTQEIYEAGSKLGPGLVSGPVVYLFQKASVYLVDEPLPSPPLVATVEGEGEEKRKEEEKEEKEEKEEEKKAEGTVDAAIIVKEEISSITATVDREVGKVSEEESESIAIIHDKKEGGDSSVPETAAIETREIGNGTDTDTIPPPPPAPKEEEEKGDSEKKESIVIEDPEKEAVKVVAETPPSAP